MSFYEQVKQIADHYGTDNQLRQAEKECVELADAINHFSEGKLDLDAVIDEMADVLVMIMQLEYQLSTHDDVRRLVINRMIYKIDRQLDRIKKETGGE